MNASSWIVNFDKSILASGAAVGQIYQRTELFCLSQLLRLLWNFKTGDFLKSQLVV
jgi:hypothetical protein